MVQSYCFNGCFFVPEVTIVQIVLVFFLQILISSIAASGVFFHLMVFVILRSFDFQRFTSPPPPPPPPPPLHPICLHGCFTPCDQVYSGEVDTVGGILAALNVTDWSWPPYASNIVLELWKRTETESLPRVSPSSHNPFSLFTFILNVGMCYVFGRHVVFLLPTLL